ncbi:MAG: hypothetical protein Q9187_008380, partial [Circinaria calcarea]
DVVFDDPFTVREWYKLGYLEIQNATPNDMTYTIHSIMDISNWESPFSHHDRKLIEPALRLASALINCPASVAFFDAIEFGYREHLAAFSILKWKTLTALAGPSRYSVGLHDAFDQRLLDLAPYVKFVWGDNTDEQWVDEQMPYAYTDETPEHINDYGRGSKITVNDGFLKDLHELDDLGPSSKTLNQALRIQFLMAVTLCHELVHAVNNSRLWAELIPEPFFRDQPLNELGLAWEEEVFGGAIANVQDRNWSSKDCQWPLFFTHFPCPQDYRMLEPHLPPEKQDVFARRAAKATYTNYYIPMAWLVQLHKQSNWDRWRYATDMKMFRIPRRVGVQFKNHEFPIDPEWSPSKSSEGDWPGDEQGKVFRVKRGKRRRVGIRDSDPLYIGSALGN